MYLTGLKGQNPICITQYFRPAVLLYSLSAQNWQTIPDRGCVRLESANSCRPVCLFRQLQTLWKLKRMLHGLSSSKMYLLPWKQWKPPSNRLCCVCLGLTHVGWGIAIWKFPQMLKLGHGLIVMIGGRKHPENKRKTADLKRACVWESNRSIPVAARNWWEVRLGNAEPESLLVLHLLYLRKHLVSFLSR